MIGKRGWPKKNETYRIYRDKDEKSYILILLDDQRRGAFDAVANVFTDPVPPSLAYTQVGRAYIATNWLKRCQWDELPEVWRDAFMRYMNNDPDYPFDPAEYRGLWRVREQPQPVK
jgi:hypothetical protein